MIRLAVVVVLALAVPTLRNAAAQPNAASRERAKKAFDKGQKLYNLGKFDEALVQYEKAYDEAELPEILFNIAQCHRNLKHYDLAIFTFRKYLREKPDADNRDAVEKLIDELEEAKRREEAKNPPQRLPPVPRPGESTTGPTHPPGTGPVGPGGPGRPAPSPPIYERWWFWTGIAVVAGGVTAGVLFLPGGGGVPDSNLGNINFPK
jgi:hypothetical protein